MAYTSSTLIGNSLKRALTSDETALLVILIPAVQRYIDRVLSSTFDTASETSRLFTIDNDTSVIDIDPCQSISAVAKVDFEGTSTQDYITSDYVAEPLNETVKRWLQLRTKSHGRALANIKITAKFTEYDFAGSKVPEDIQLVASQICADVISLISGSETNIKSESIEGHTVTYGNAVDNIDRAVQNSPLVQGILNSRKDLWVG